MASPRPAAPSRWRNSVLSVRPGSPAHNAGVLPGDRLLTVNGHQVRDVIDCRFYATDVAVRLEIQRDGRRHVLEVEKEPDEDLGLEFVSALFDGTRVCNNRCFFCFVEGLPRGVRPLLRVKDDDYRLSFLHGSFVTLTNLDESDWERIAEQGLSPLYVSVHATDLTLRRRLLGNPQAPDVVEQLRRLGKLGVTVHAQVVLLRGINDGTTLEKTLGDLAALHPTVASVAVVPAGRTSHHRPRRGSALTVLEPFSEHEARRIVDCVEAWQRDFRARQGTSLVYAADELYLTARLRLPPAALYDSYPQYQNGIGLTRSLLDDWSRTKRQLLRGGSQAAPPSAALTLACGTLIAPLMERLAAEARKLLGLRLDVVAVENRFFGPSVTVSGLLTGSDLLTTLEGRERTGAVLVSRSMLDYDAERFLDDLTPAEVESRLGAPLVFAEGLGSALEQLEGLECAA